MIVAWINFDENIRGTEGGHVDGLVRLQPACVDHQLQLLQGHCGELSVKPQGVVVGSLK